MRIRLSSFPGAAAASRSCIMQGKASDRDEAFKPKPRHIGLT